MSPLALGEFVSHGGAFMQTLLGVAHEERELAVSGLSDFPLYLYGALVCFLLQWSIRMVLLNPLASWALPNTKKKSREIAKFAQSATEFYVYSFFFLAGLRVCCAQPWIWPSKHWWIGKLQGSHEFITPSFKFFYLLYGGRYLAQLITIFIEPKRKDFLIQVLHHSTTAVLVPLSYQYGYVRIGAAVMVLLDPGDPPLHAAKMCKYMAGGDTSSWWQFAADRWLEVFAITFLLTRCGLYPYIVWSAVFEAKGYIDHSQDPGAYLGIYLLDELVAIALLVVLMILQFWWAWLLLKVVWKTLQTGHAADDRSDDEDDEQDTANHATKKRD